MTRNETAVAVFNNADAGAVTFADKKGNLHGITAEGALFKGGAALAALKDVAIEAALMKAQGGRYRAASDILCAAFPKVGKAAESLIGTPWSNKSTMATLIGAVLRADYKETTAAGKLTKQAEARMLARALCSLPAFAEVAANEKETIDA